MKDGIDEDLFKELVSHGTDYKSAEVTRANKRIKAPASLPKDDRTQKKKTANYSLFLERRFDARSRACVYINEVIKDKLERISTMLPEHSLSLANFLDNILEHHLETYRDQINELYREKYNPEKII